jgi:hypothetical protein
MFLTKNNKLNMKKIIKNLAINFSVIALMSISIQVQAEPEWRSWEYSDSTIENGVWSIDEVCEGFGEECWYGQTRTITQQ